MKKAVIIYIINALLFATCVYAQQSRFKITYDYNGQAEWAESILILEDSSILFSAFCNTSLAGGMLTANVNNSGAVGSVKMFQQIGHSYTNSFAGSLMQVDTSYFIAGLDQWQDSINLSYGYSYPYLARLNATRDTEWVRRFDFDTSAFYLGVSSVAINEPSILISGCICYRNHPGVFNYFLMKIDTAGNLLWQKTYGQNGVDERNTSLQALGNGQIMLSGVRFNPAHTIANPWVLILDSSGNMLWQHLYTRAALDAGGGYTKPASTGGFYLTGAADTIINSGDTPYTCYIARMNASGGFVWLKVFNSPWFTQLWDFYELDNGDVVFCGDKEDSATGSQFGYIAKIDSSGNLLWWRTYHEWTLIDGYLSCIRPAPDGGFVACGSAFGVNDHNQNAWIIKTDSLGCALIDCTLDIPEIEQAKPELLVYPNPAKDEINVSMNTGVPGEGTVISAYDMTGRRMVRYVPEPGRQKATLNSSGWSSGMYIITVQRSNGALTTTKVTIAR
jgi:hypothetical protein